MNGWIKVIPPRQSALVFPTARDPYLYPLALLFSGSFFLCSFFISPFFFSPKALARVSNLCFDWGPMAMEKEREAHVYMAKLSEQAERYDGLLFNLFFSFLSFFLDFFFFFNEVEILDWFWYVLLFDGSVADLLLFVEIFWNVMHVSISSISWCLFWNIILCLFFWMRLVLWLSLFVGCEVFFSHLFVVIWILVHQYWFLVDLESLMEYWWIWKGFRLLSKQWWERILVICFQLSIDVVFFLDWMDHVLWFFWWLLAIWSPSDVDVLIYFLNLWENWLLFNDLIVNTTGIEPEMVEAMKKVAKLDLELTVEERNLLSVGYKNVIGARRASWRIMSSIEQKEESKGNENNVKLIKGYRQKVEEELTKICNDILSIIDEHLIPASSTGESSVFYYKM